MSRAPRILLVNYEYPPIGGGAGTATAAMAGALADLGCDVVVLTSRFQGQSRHERAAGFSISRVPVVRRRPDRCTPAEMLTFVASAGVAALRLAKRWRPDLTIAFFGIPCGPVAWLLRARFGVQYVVSLRGGDVPGFDWDSGAPIYHALTAPFIRFFWRRATAVVANGVGLRQLAETALPGLSVAVVPNGVDAARHAPSAHARNAPASPRLLLVGRLVRQKGCDVLLRALASLRHIPFTLEFVGDGPDRQTLRAQAESAGIADRVLFSGWVPHDRIAEHYRAADVFVFASRIEGMPNVVLEAMAYALPIVATDVPGNRDLLEDGHTALLVQSENEEQLAEALQRVLQDSALARRLGAAAREHVIAHHSWHASAAEYLRLGGIRVPGVAAPLAREAS